MKVSAVCTLKPDEDVVAVLRHHWLPYASRTILASVLVVMPFFLMIPLAGFGRIGAAIFIESVLAGLLLGGRLAYAWHWNAFVVTTHRVVDVDQRGFFDRKVSEAWHENIEDVSHRVKGVAAAIFGIGSVSLQTAGSAPNLELEHVWRPADAHRLISDLVAERREAPFRGRRASVILGGGEYE